MQCPRGLGSVPPILLFLPPTLASMCRATAVDIVACTVQFGVSQASVLRQPSCYSTVQYSTVHTGTPSPSSPFTAEISTVVVAPVGA